MRYLLWLLLLTVSIPSFAATYYVSPTGTVDPDSGTCDNTCAGTTCCRPSLLWDDLVDNDTVIFRDGIYTGSSYLIRPPTSLSGSSGNPITIKAENYGEAKLNGSGSTMPLKLYQNDWLVIEGFDIYNSNDNVVQIGSDCDNNIFREIVAWDANPDDNAHVFSIYNTADNNLLEDCAGFGYGRKIFAAGGDNNTFRRCWAKHEGNRIGGPQVVFSFSYNSSGNNCENCIGTWDDSLVPGGGSEPAYSIFRWHDSQSSYNSDSEVYGSIGYVLNGADNIPGWGIAFNDTDHYNIDIVNSVGMWDTSFDSEDSVDLRNTSVSDDQLTITDFTLIGGNGGTIGSDWEQSDVQIVSRVEDLPDSIYTGNGARVCFRYEDGVETATKLWPWPMNARILAATTADGRPVDVTDEIEGIFGQIPDSCRTDAPTATRRIMVISETLQPSPLLVTPPPITVTVPSVDVTLDPITVE